MKTIPSELEKIRERMRIGVKTRLKRKEIREDLYGFPSIEDVIK